VLSQFLNPPSGRSRALMSMAFRQLTRHVGGLQVNFAGTYVFHRSWLQRIDLAKADSDTFLFSFQLLELMRREGAHFETIEIPTYLRAEGKSREATLPRIAKMCVEIGKARLSRTRE
jgi:hypothetical protein